MVFLYLLLAFLLIGLFTFGGGYAMIPLIKETVSRFSWLDEEGFLDMLGLAEVTPGPISINMATYLGSTASGAAFGDAFWARLVGSALATFGVVLPAFLIMLLVAWFLTRFMNNVWVQGMLDGIKPVAVALILSAGIIIMGDVLFPRFYEGGSHIPHMEARLGPLLVFALVAINAFLMKKAFHRKIGPIWILVMGAAIGLMANLAFPGIMLS